MKKVLIFTLNLSILSIILLLTWFLHGNVYLWGDYNWFVSIKQILDNFFVWNNNTFVFYNLCLFIKYYIFYFYQYFLHLPIYISNFLWFLTYFVIWLYSFYSFINYISVKTWETNIKRYILYIFSYLYIFSLYFTIRFVDGHIDFMVFYYVFPLVILFLLKFLDTDKIKFWFLSIFTLIFLWNLYISPYILFFWVFFYWIAFFLYINISDKRVKISKISILILTFLLISLPFLLNFYFYKTSFSLWELWTNPVNMLINFSNKVNFYDFFIWNWYWALFDGFNNNLYFTFSNTFSFKIINYFIFLSFALIILFWLINKKDKIRKIYFFSLIFLLTAFTIEVFLFLQVKYWNLSFIESIIKILPFLREPVAKVEWLIYFWLIVNLFLLYIYINNKYKNTSKIFIIFILSFTCISIYLFINSFSNRYSTNFISKKYLNNQKDINVLSDKDRFIILPSNTDSVCLSNSTKYCWVDMLKYLMRWEYYTAWAWWVWLKISETESSISLLKKIKNKWINKIIIQKDYKFLAPWSNFEKNMINIIDEIKKDFKIIYSNKYIDIIDLWKRNYISFDKNINLLDFDKISNAEYRGIFNLKWRWIIIFNDTFNKYWDLMLNWNEIFIQTQTDDYTNSWTISKDEIIKYVNKNYWKELKKEWYPKKLGNWQIDYKYYKLNPDWSIDVELTLYFKPQLYFYIWLAISVTTFILLLLYLWYDFVKERRKKTNKNLQMNN